MKKIKNFKLLSIGFLSLFILIFLIPIVHADDVTLLVEESESNYYLHSTLTVWKREDADPNKDYYAVKLTVAEHYAQNNIFIEIMRMGAGLNVYHPAVGGGIINRAERKPSAGIHLGGTIYIGFGGITIACGLPTGVVTLATDTNTEQHWAVSSCLAINCLDFVIKVSTPEGQGLYISSWCGAHWFTFTGLGYWLPDREGYGPSHYIYVGPERDGGGCPILSVYNGTDYIEEGLLNIHSPSFDIKNEHTLIMKPEAVDNRYLLRLTEHYKTISHIDNVKLFGRLSNGVLIPLQLTSAFHSAIGNVIDTLWLSDDNRVDVLGADHNDGISEFIDLEFNAHNGQSFIEFLFVIEGYNAFVK